MINIKKNMKSKDFGCLLIAILSNKSIYPLIDEEYEKNKKEYDELILKSDFFEHDRYKIIPEDMKEYSMKLTAIFLSKNGNDFVRKILKSGWPGLYDYIKNTDCVVYEDIKQIKDYGLDDLTKGYTIFIIKQMMEMFNKEMTHTKDESKREIDSYNNRLSVAWAITIKENFLKLFDKIYQSSRVKFNEDNALQQRIRLEKNKIFWDGLLFLMSYYAIDLWDVRQNFKISEEDKELIVSYLNASELTIYDITNSVQEKENMFDYIIISRIFKVMANKYRALDSKYLKLYKSSIKKDFELEELKTQIYCLKEQIKRLECENEQLKENVKIVSLDKVREKEKEIIDIKKQYNEIIKEKDKMIEENNEEIQLLKMTVEDLLDESHYVNEEQITNDALTGIRGVIIGGTPQWQQHMRKIVPHFKFVGTEQLNYDTKILENADKIYFNTAYNSHAMFYKTMNAVRKNKTEIVFINSNSVTAGFKMFGQKSGQYTGEHLVS